MQLLTNFPTACSQPRPHEEGQCQNHKTNSVTRAGIEPTAPVYDNIPYLISQVFLRNFNDILVHPKPVSLEWELILGKLFEDKQQQLIVVLLESQITTESLQKIKL